MKFTPEVLAALQVLTDAAENDFELHRICTLVRDLVAPPAVEQVDDTHQRFNGVNYHKNKDGHYEKIHRVVWAYYNGEIPEGYDIHHDNENPADNSIGNLVALTRAEHRQRHNYINPIKRNVPANLICPNCGKTFTTIESTKKFCSEKCKIFYHNRHHQPVHKICEHCGKEFVLEGLDVMHAKTKRFCSWECYCASGHEIRTCPVCGKTFETQKGRREKCCSRKCGGILAQKHRRENPKVELVTCAYCGKEFEADARYKAKYCSRKCKAKANILNSMETRTCAICGATFSCRKYNPTQTCGLTCQTKLRDADKLNCK